MRKIPKAYKCFTMGRGGWVAGGSPEARKIFNQSEGARTAYFIPERVGEGEAAATESTLFVCLCVCPAGGSPGGRPRPTHKGNLKVLSARVGRGRAGRDPPTKKTLRFPLSCDPPVATHPTQRRDPPGATHPVRPTRRDPPAATHPARPTRRDPPAATHPPRPHSYRRRPGVR